MNATFAKFLLAAFFSGCLLGAPAVAAPRSNGPAPGANHAKLSYTRIFKSSSPEFIEIVVWDDTDAATFEIRQLDEEPGASPFKVGAQLRTKMFELAGQLNHFQNVDLDVHRRIANLGEKTFRWQEGSQSYSTKFNYTLNSAASQLMQIFEGLARQQELVTMLERRMKYDRLGINDALLEFETDLDHKLLPEPQRALPALDQIAGDSRVIEIGRQRARALAERIRHSG